MKKRILIHVSIGFVIGVAMMLLIPVLFNRGPDGMIYFYSEEFLSRVGSPALAMLLTLLIYGLYGAACVGGMLIYEIENWSLALATAVHYGVVALGYAFCAWLLRWNLTVKGLLLIELMMTLGFVLIWLFMYLRYKAEVRELNELIRDRGKPEE